MPPGRRTAITWGVAAARLVSRSSEHAGARRRAVKQCTVSQSGFCTAKGVAPRSGVQPGPRVVGCRPIRKAAAKLTARIIVKITGANAIVNPSNSRTFTKTATFTVIRTRKVPNESTKHILVEYIRRSASIIINGNAPIIRKIRKAPMPSSAATTPVIANTKRKAI
jgi:hypothetical protein